MDEVADESFSFEAFFGKFLNNTGKRQTSPDLDCVHDSDLLPAGHHP
jgi:hypothetical protein